jgi:membrane protein
VIDAVGAAAGEYGRDRCPQLAAAISYHVLFSLVPLFTFLVSIFGLVLQDDDIREEVIDALIDRFPLSEEAGVDLEQILANVPTPASVIGIVSIAALLWSASGMTAATRVGLTAAFDDGTHRPFFQSKLIDLLLVLGVAGLMLVAFGLSIVVHAVERWSETLAASLGAAGFGTASVLGTLVPLGLVFAAFLLLYHYVPPSRPRFGDIWVGALVAALASQLVSVGFSYYLSTVATYHVLYGSLGSVLAFLTVVYLQASVFLFGGELASEWPRQAEAPPAGATAEKASFGRRLTSLVRGLFVRS